MSTVVADRTRTSSTGFRSPVPVITYDEPMTKGVRLSVAALAIGIAAVCYSSWVLEHLWPGGLDPLRSFLSELDAVGRPHREVYETGDIITSVAAIVAALVMMLPRPLVRGFPATTAVVAFGCFGASTLADALLPIECIPGVDADCPWEPSGLFPQLHHVHALTSSLAVSSLFVTMIAASLAAFRSQRWHPVRVSGTTVFAIVVLATVWMLVADNLTGDYRLGLAQRIQVGGMSVWMAIWALAVRWWPNADGRQPRSTTPSPTTPEYSASI